MAQVAKRKLSASTDGKSITAAATASPGTTIHTATTSVVSGTWDEIWLYAANLDPVDRILTIQLGGTATTDAITVTIPSLAGRFLVVDGAILQNSAIVRAYCSVAANVVITGYVNQITA